MVLQRDASVGFPAYAVRCKRKSEMRRFVAEHARLWLAHATGAKTPPRLLLSGTVRFVTPTLVWAGGDRTSVAGTELCFFREATAAPSDHTLARYELLLGCFEFVASISNAAPPSRTRRRSCSSAYS